MMKKVTVVLAILVLFFAVSCATTKGADIPDRVRVVEPAVNEEQVVAADVLWDVIKALAVDEELSEDLKVDEGTKTLVMENVVLGGNVGFSARDGEVIVRITMRAEEDKATCIVSFVDAYTTYQVGPISKKVSMGMTELGMQEYDWQVNALLDTFEYAIDQYLVVYGVQQGWYGEEAQKAYMDALATK